MNRDYRALRRELNVLKAQVTEISSKSTLNLLQCNTLESICNEFKIKLDEFRGVVAEALELSDLDGKEFEDLENELMNEVRQFSDIYFSANGKIRSQKHKLAEEGFRDSVLPGPPDCLNQTFYPSCPPSLPKLKKIAVPNFDGNVLEFQNFRSLFDNLVHSSTDLSDVQKLYYLKESLVGEAKEIIRDFPLENSAYVEAWNYLNERYNNKRLVIRTLFKKFVNTEVIKNTSQIRRLLDQIDIFTRGLRANGLSIDNTFSKFICFFVTTRLDNRTRLDWENSIQSSKDFPVYKELYSFLQNRSFTADERQPEINSSSNSSSNQVEKKWKKATLVSTCTPSAKCTLCGGTHAIVNCKAFAAKNSHDRYDIAKKGRLCLKCLCLGHFTSECKSENCQKCEQSHHVLLHHDFANSKSKLQSTDQSSTSTLSPKVSLSAISSIDAAVVLPTAVVRVKINRRYVLARVLLDNCSQPNIVSESFVKKHRLELERSDGTPIDSIGNSTSSDRTALLTLSSRYEANEISIEADVVPRIPYTLPSEWVVRLNEKFPNLKLAELCIHRNNVDIVVGGRHFYKLVQGDRLFAGDLCAQQSDFGWVVGGPDDHAPMVVTPNCSFVTSYAIDDRLKEFWKLEEATHVGESAPEHSLCETHFEKNVTREFDGKFCVRLPFKIARSSIGESRARALAALIKVERQWGSEVRQQYVEFMREYEALGHMVKIDSLLPEPSEVYYIPHRAVLRPSSSTTKLRVVFNASAKSRSNLSLNDMLLVGPVLQPELFDTLIRFRSYRFAFCADVSKMYRCINVHAQDQDMQRILWREDPKDPVSAYRLTTVTYGTAPASFLATKCLAMLADSISKTQPDIARAIRSDFYMDDLLTGAETLPTAVDLRRGIHDTLMGAQLPLRKYISNSQPLLDTLDCSLVEKLTPLQFGEGAGASVLGLQWDPIRDCFRLSTDLRDLEKVVSLTKRIILSEIARIFDPLGFASPVTIRAKIILQDLWREAKGWDDPVSELVSLKFREYYRELLSLSAFSVPRLYSEFSTYVRLQLVGFCDASEKAYCAAIYARTEIDDCLASSLLVCSKTRVAPIKELTIPRLELQAALLVAQLASRVAKELKVDSRNVFHFSDSTVVLCWLEGDIDRWTIFVRNRVAKIRELSVNSWCYVPTKENPADLGTRGISVAKLLDCHLWLRGPSFLCEKDPFVRNHPGEKISCIPETLVNKCSLVTASSQDRLLENIQKFSDLNKLINVFAYVSRCAVKRADRPLSRSLSAAERDNSFLTIVRFVQNQEFPLEIEALKSGLPVQKGSSLLSLSPFLDPKGILRVGGRLRNSSWSFEKKHPIILRAKSFLVKLIVWHIHLRYFHVTRSFILNVVYSKFWIVGSLSNVVKSVVNTCTVCIRYKALPMGQLMGQLPASRITVSRPFSNIGIDFAGYFQCKCVKHRTVKHYKIYLAVFVCFVTRGVHLEIVSSLSTEDFLSAFVRFTSRRGVPALVYSDNGTNFVGANNLILANNDRILNHAAREKFTWKFIPPKAPHQGGIWEAAVRSAKYHLLRATQGTTLNFEEYATLFARIESILNSRPLCYKSLPDNRGGVLTPAHFWLGSSLLSPDESSDCSQPDLDLPLTRRYELVAGQVNSFWSQWSRDYLNQLQPKSKWKVVRSNIRVNDIVLIRDDLAPPGVWKYGVVVAVYPDQEGLIRVVDVRSSGIVKRRAVTSLVMLCPEETPQPVEHVAL